jgi:hypothetical protein
MGKAVSRPPRIFRVNWFRKDANGKFIWPGFAENMRVLKWIVDRCSGRAQGVDTALGVIPRYEDLNWCANSPAACRRLWNRAAAACTRNWPPSCQLSTTAALLRRSNILSWRCST